MQPHTDTPMRLVAVPDGRGGTIHALRPANDLPADKKGKAKRTPPDPIRTNGNKSGEMLRLFIERIERIEEDKAALNDDLKDVYGEAKSNGYDVKIMRTIVAIRKVEKNTRLETEALIETYKSALGIE